MEAPLQATTFEPLTFGLSQAPNPHSPNPNIDHDYLHGSHFSPNETSYTTGSADSITAINSAPTHIPEEEEEEEEEECLVDSQPICFKENPFLVANRKGKGLPLGEQILSGPPVGYGRKGQLQPWLFSKAPSSDYTRTDSPIRDAPYSPTIQPANIHYTSTPTGKDSTSSSVSVYAAQISEDDASYNRDQLGIL